MLKNISWDTKEKTKVSLILFFAVFSKIFFETLKVGMNQAEDIFIAAAAAIIFVVYFMTAVTDKAFRLCSAQGISVALMVIAVLSIIISFRLISREMLYSVIFSSVMILMAQHFYLLPVAALFGIVILFLENMPGIQSVLMSGVPAAIGVSCVCLSKQVKDSAIWKKIYFAVVELVMILTAAKAFSSRSNIMVFHNLKTQIWDSAASFAAIILFAALAVFAVKKGRTAGEFFGYIVVAAFGVMPMFMEMKYVLVSAMAMFMTVVVVSKEGNLADIVFDDIVKKICSKKKR